MSMSRAVWSLATAVAVATVLPFAASLSATPASAATASPATGSRPSLEKIQAAPRTPAGAQSLGPLGSSAPVTGTVVLKPRDEGAVQAFISAVTNRRSPHYHQYLAPGAYGARFGPAPATIASVKKALQADGLTVTSVASDGLLVDFSGQASNVEAAFHTGINRYRLADGTSGQATTSAVALPSTIAGSVSSVLGLDHLVKAQPADIRRGTAAVGSHPAARFGQITDLNPGAPAACPAATTDAQYFGGLTDDQIANAYGAFGLYNSGDLGANQHIAVYELEPFLPSDLQTFDTCYFGAPAAAQMAGTGGVAGGRLSIVPVDGGQPAGPGVGEAILDVQDVSAMAPAANIDVYEAPNTTFGGIDEYAQIINRDQDQIVTSSWGLCEQAVQTGEPGVQQAENLLFEQAAAQGQTIFNAAGDTGSDACNAFRTASPVSPILSVSDPASQPYVVAVGGTTIDAATQPPSEHVWNDGALWGAGAGGISQSWAMPNWQLGSAGVAQVPGVDNQTNIIAAQTYEDTFDSAAVGSNYGFCLSQPDLGPFEAACRELPDVSAQADEFTGAITVYAAEFGGWVTIGGTSSATPIWAGLLALVNESATTPACTSPNPATPAPGVGFVSPLLYQVASTPAGYSASFNDITAGNNDPYGSPDLFPATTGFDMASGLGSPRLTGPGGTAGLAANLCAAADASPSSSRPTVTGLTPSTGPTSGGGTAVLITGTGFENAQGTSIVTGVQVGGFEIPTAFFTVTSPTTIAASVPPSNTFVNPVNDTSDGAGAYQVTVSTNVDGALETSAPNPNSVFTYVDTSGTNGTGSPVPSVTSVHTYAGPESGANTVDIFGTGFTGTTGVTFGGVPVPGFQVLSDTEISATVPAYSTASGPGQFSTTCAQDGSFFSPSENASNDICQVQVVVTNTNGSSRQYPILPLYEGPYAFNANGAIPAPAGEEAAPQPSEYDYLPAPTITSISSDNGPSSLASELGGTVVTITGTGLNLAGLDWLDVGDPTQQSSQDSDLVTVTGTEIQFVAPAMPITIDTVIEPVTVETIVGSSNGVNATYAGIPVVDSVTSSYGPDSIGPDSGIFGAPDTGGTPISISGAGFDQVFGPIGFVDNVTPFSLGTQYSYQVSDNQTISTNTVQQNPGLVDVEVCSATACSSNPSPNPPTDLFLVFPPGDPQVQSVNPDSGPADGGTLVTITGQNLGCVTGVSFGGVAATMPANQPAILDCGSTGAVTAVAPPGTVGATVPITVTTFESDTTPGAHPTSSATYTYTAVPPAFTADSPPAVASLGVPYSYTFVASGDPAPTYSVSSGAVPPGLHLDTVSGVLSGTPIAGGHFTFKVAASNGVNPPTTTPLLTIDVAGSDSGYRLVGANGAVFSFGSDPPEGSLAGVALNRPIVSIVSSPGSGYWLVASDGGVFTFGDARFYGSTGNMHLNAPIVGMAATPDGKGYWLVGSDGGVFTFGDARFYGSTGNVHLNRPVVGIAATPDGKGYWLVASDGGVFSFGDARFHGSTGNIHLAEPIKGMAATPDGGGYWLVASDGGVFTFGDAAFFGSLGGRSLNSPIIDMVASPDGLGYGLVSSNGDVTSFGDFTLFGSVANRPLTAPIVGIAV